MFLEIRACPESVTEDFTLTGLFDAFQYLRALQQHFRSPSTGLEIKFDHDSNAPRLV